eukprot:CAMPEP_0172005060 /NCGR_PEP_ID=MMETSP1041-20130122/4826_1 /TAXON_ID=464988 /ORGANISM="Hemiselmis andersenii, Strain CCMP439" /LENGTH=91 /DNA_ID=CAMNT_0012658991 /DNA_START=1 /DNA_END=279 /DNA_ORIENTATION=-
MKNEGAGRGFGGVLRRRAGRGGWNWSRTLCTEELLEPKGRDWARGGCPHKPALRSSVRAVHGGLAGGRSGSAMGMKADPGEEKKIFGEYAS